MRMRSSSPSCRRSAAAPILSYFAILLLIFCICFGFVFIIFWDNIPARLSMYLIRAFFIVFYTKKVPNFAFCLLLSYVCNIIFYVDMI